jgi:hypothetical protein
MLENLHWCAMSGGMWQLCNIVAGATNHSSLCGFVALHHQYDYNARPAIRRNSASGANRNAA